MDKKEIRKLAVMENNLEEIFQVIQLQLPVHKNTWGVLVYTNGIKKLLPESVWFWLFFFKYY